MKYFLSLFAILALIGAGCTADTNTSVNSEENVIVEPNDEESARENDSNSDNADVSADTQTGVETDAQADSQPEVTTEQLNIDTETNAEGETPVVDIVLGATADLSLDMESGNFFFSPNAITASPGQKISIRFAKNSGFHTFVIDEIGAKFTVAEGETFIFTAPDNAGEYAFYCDIGSHRAMGMEGVLTVK